MSQHPVIKFLLAGGVTTAVGLCLQTRRLTCFVLKLKPSSSHLCGETAPISLPAPDPWHRDSMSRARGPLPRYRGAAGRPLPAARRGGSSSRGGRPRCWPRPSSPRCSVPPEQAAAGLSARQSVSRSVGRSVPPLLPQRSPERVDAARPSLGHACCLGGGAGRGPPTTFPASGPPRANRSARGTLPFPLLPFPVRRW